MGNTKLLEGGEIITTVHPHTHGEHLPQNYQTVPYYGSSPHAWGTRQAIEPAVVL